MLECVINISEGSEPSIISRLSQAAGDSLLDIHSDQYHNRSVFTLFGREVYRDSLALTRKAFDLLDLRDHVGVHPRIGVVDVVPFVPIGNSDMFDALQTRNRFASDIATEYSVPIFLYGPDRTLPQLRREAFKSLSPDFGPSSPHLKYGSIAVGARELLVAYNIYLAIPDLTLAKEVAAQVRSPYFRTLGLQVGNEVQVSANLINPLSHGIYELYQAVSKFAEVSKGELVGLAPRKVIEESPKDLWNTLDLDIDKALEIRASRKFSDPSARRIREN